MKAFHPDDFPRGKAGELNYEERTKRYTLTFTRRNPDDPQQQYDKVLEHVYIFGRCRDGKIGRESSLKL